MIIIYWKKITFLAVLMDFCISVIPKKIHWASIMTTSNLVLNYPKVLMFPKHTLGKDSTIMKYLLSTSDFHFRDSTGCWCGWNEMLDVCYSDILLAQGLLRILISCSAEVNKSRIGTFSDSSMYLQLPSTSRIRWSWLFLTFIFDITASSIMKPELLLILVATIRCLVLNTYCGNSTNSEPYLIIIKKIGNPDLMLTVYNCC